MGWWQDMWKAIADWLMDKIIRPLITWITDTINKIVAGFRAWKHEFLKALAEFLEDNTHAFFFLISVILASIVLAQIIPVIAAALKTGALAAIIQTIKDGLGKVSKLFIDLQLLNSLLKVAWPKYRELMGTLNKAVSGLMDELELGAGFMTSWYAALNGVLVNTAAIFGLPQESAMLDYMNQTAEYTKRIDEDFRRYANDPGLLVTDFITDVLLPAADGLTTAQRAALEESYDRLEFVEGELVLFQNWKRSVSDLLDTLPDEIAQVVNEHWLPVSERIDSFFDQFNLVLLPALDAFKEAITYKLSIEADRTDALEKRLEDPYGILAMYELYPREERESFQEYMARIAGYQYDRDAGAAEFGLYQAALALDTVTTRWFETPVALAPGAARVLSFELPEVKSGTINKGWFQGEY